MASASDPGVGTGVEGAAAVVGVRATVTVDRTVLGALAARHTGNRGCR